MKSKPLSISIYLGGSDKREERIAALDKLAQAIPANLVGRPGAERSILIQLLADHPIQAAEALALFFRLIGHGETPETPPGVVVWNGREYEIVMTPLQTPTMPVGGVL